jgi:hypothetical protein
MAIGRRLAAGALALVATFGILAAGAAVARQATVTSPVARAMRLGAVVGYRLVTAAPAPAVAVRLRAGVDLEAVCERLDGRLTGIFGVAPTLLASGPGQAVLEPLVESIGVPVAQGIATGQFVAMSKTIERLAGGARDRARIEVDARAVYVTLRSRNGRDTAYVVFPRSPAADGGGAT